MTSGFDSATRLKQVRGLGSAREGVHHWTMQRLTALGNMLLIPWLLLSLLLLPDLSHGSVLAWAAQPLVAIPLLLISFNSFWHARLGVRVMIEDYVGNEGLRMLALALLTLFIVAAGGTAAFAVLKIAFGAA